jgi:mannose-6-phosphate isomerase
MRRYPELSEFIDTDICTAMSSAVNPGIHKQHESVKLFFTALMQRSMTHSQALATAIDKLTLRLEATRANASETEKLFLNLRAKYGYHDVGLLCLFVLNLVHLNAGEAIFTEAGVPHAYLKGNIIECMANSDNVVRVGLTPKFKDAEALLDIMRFEPGPVKILRSTVPGRTVTYKTPASEFRMSKTEFPAGVLKHESTADRPQILLVTQGEIAIRYKDGMQTIGRGQSVLIPANLAEYSILAKQSAVIFKADIPH